MVIELLGDICKVSASILFAIVGWKKLMHLINIRKDYYREKR